MYDEFPDSFTFTKPVELLEFQGIVINFAAGMSTEVDYESLHRDVIATARILLADVQPLHYTRLEDYVPQEQRVLFISAEQATSIMNQMLGMLNGVPLHSARPTEEDREQALYDICKKYLEHFHNDQAREESVEYSKRIILEKAIECRAGQPKRNRDLATLNDELITAVDKMYPSAEREHSASEAAPLVPKEARSQSRVKTFYQQYKVLKLLHERVHKSCSLFTKAKICIDLLRGKRYTKPEAPKG